ncbi:MAG: hypothetical protein QOE65_1611 [Solirubrobacteraceae bacterium]|nr:hypothetical protein [Solirubrobacteraceae bacterium]
MLAAALAAGALGAAGTGCGGGGKGAAAGASGERNGSLVWDETPVLVRVRHIPTDRVLIGTVRNDSLRPLDLKSSDVGVRDGAGRRLRAFAQFAGSYAHGLYGAYEKPHPLPPAEKQRLGLIVRILPGKTAPLVVSYRTSRRDRAPLHVEWASGTLPVPTRLREQYG